MSWDFHINIDAGGEDPITIGDINYTHNCNPMLRDVGIEMEDLIGRNAGEVGGIYKQGLEKLKANPEKYISMNPPNGWGSYETLLPVLEEVIKLCERAPKGTVYISL